MRKWSKFLTLVLMLVAQVASAQSTKTNEISAGPSDGDHSKSIAIHEEIFFSVEPKRLYEALLDSKQFAEFSGRPADINREVGGAFSVFKDHIIGRNLELVPNKRIVQAWRVVTWPEGVYSIARFELSPQEHGTKMVFEHIGFPKGLHDHLAEGWEENYWALLKKYLH